MCAPYIWLELEHHNHYLTISEVCDVVQNAAHSIKNNKNHRMIDSLRISPILFELFSVLQKNVIA